MDELKYASILEDMQVIKYHMNNKQYLQGLLVSLELNNTLMDELHKEELTQ